MAQRRFTLSGVRRESGVVANGDSVRLYLPGTDTLAHVSATDGGSALASSQVGLDSKGGATFYGPTDLTDELDLEFTAEVSFGRQRIYADPDPRLDALEAGGPDLEPRVEVIELNGVNVRSYGTDQDAFQDAIDEAQSRMSGNAGAPPVDVPPGIYRWTSGITWKDGPIRGLGNFGQAHILWDGAPGGTMITKSATPAVWYTNGYLENLVFDEGDNEAGTVVDLTAMLVDKFLRLRELSFENCSGDAIKVAGWVNLHWEHLRWDNVGGYAIRATPPSGMSYRSFVVDKFTYDHSRSSGPASGFVLIDNSAQSAVGSVKFAHGRIEVNNAWAGGKGIIVDDDSLDTQMQVHLEDVQFQGQGSEVVYLKTGVTASPTLLMDNVLVGTAHTVTGGTVRSQDPVVVPRGVYLKAVINPLGAMVLGSQSDNAGHLLDLYGSTWGAFKPLRVFRSGDTAPRLNVDETGRLEWGSGSGAVDANLYRDSANTLKTDDTLIVAADHYVNGTVVVGLDTNLYRSAANVLGTDDALELVEQGADPSAPAANRGRLYLKDNGSGKTALFVRFPTGTVQQLAIEP